MPAPSHDGAGFFSMCVLLCSFGYHVNLHPVCFWCNLITSERINFFFGKRCLSLNGTMYQMKNMDSMYRLWLVFIIKSTKRYF